MDIRLKRAYEPASDEDGYRVLVERLWPRGVSRERARLDEWAKEIAPSPELRRWYGHDPSLFEQFRRRYLDELTGHAQKLEELRRRARTGPLTLVYAARDEARNSAALLAEVLRGGGDER
ncbi:MAG: DUF488 family protein [Gaiellaceae bacterium]|jgi:uncharacterized protein YeaO (DUF488 family)